MGAKALHDSPQVESAGDDATVDIVEIADNALGDGAIHTKTGQELHAARRKHGEISPNRLIRVKQTDRSVGID